MRVVVGPVSANSAAAWIGHAREILDDLDSLAPGECFSTPEICAIFDSYLSEWEAALHEDEKFVWERDIPAEQVEYHLHAYHQVADMLAGPGRRHHTAGPPAEGEEFALALLGGVLSALEAESPSSASFAKHLGAFWPGRDLTLL